MTSYVHLLDALQNGHHFLPEFSFHNRPIKLPLAQLVVTEFKTRPGGVDIKQSKKTREYCFRRVLQPHAHSRVNASPQNPIKLTCLLYTLAANNN
jgi:hypothetical protein